MVATDHGGALNWALGDDATWVETTHPNIISKGKKIMRVPTRIAPVTAKRQENAPWHILGV